MIFGGVTTISRPEQIRFKWLLQGSLADLEMLCLYLPSGGLYVEFPFEEHGTEDSESFHPAAGVVAISEDSMRYECVIGALVARIALTEQYLVVESSIARSISSTLSPSP
jgi:hypothetical protein